jgi:hypothetical protein
LTSQYATWVTGDLERNVKELEHVGEQIAALQAQLAALRRNHAVLVNIQQALGIPAPVVEAESAAAELAPRKKAAAKRHVGRQPAAKRGAGRKAPASGGKAAAKKDTGETSAERPAEPLLDLVREYLADQNEPRSVADISTALARRHPGRSIKPTVVRNNLETLVAKDRAQRTKRGASVFYTALDAPVPEEAA